VAAIERTLPEAPVAPAFVSSIARPASRIAAQAEEVAAQLAATMGQPTTEHIEYAADLISSIPSVLARNAREPFGARAVVFALLLDLKEEIRTVQLETLSRHADPAVLRTVGDVMASIAQVAAQQRLPLLEMTLPALRLQSPAQWTEFMTLVDYLIRADNRVSVFEFALRQLVLRQYRAVSGKLKERKEIYGSVDAVVTYAAQLISILAWWGSGFDKEKALRAFEIGASSIDGGRKIGSLLPQDALSLAQMESALLNLARGFPIVRKAVIDACVACIMADRTVTLEEMELIRAIGSALNCPVPPFIFSATAGRLVN
jgi:hypothetical protein